MALIEVSDFVGKYRVSKDQYNTIIVQQYIDKYVPIYLARVLGVTLSQLVLADLDGSGVPEDDDLKAIFLPFMVDIECYLDYELDSRVAISSGVKEMLLGFIYWHIIADRKVSISPITGTTNLETENSKANVLPESQVYERYNIAVNTSRVIQYKCRTESNTYPTFNGEYIQYNYVL